MWDHGRNAHHSQGGSTGLGATENIVRVEEKRLSLAAHKAARQERLLDDPTLPDEQVKPVDRKLHQLQTQPLTAEEESQEGR